MDGLTDLSLTHLTILVVSLGIAFGFEVVNGFHDAATAIATVMYTRSLSPVTAVVWSGTWNALGVLYAMATHCSGARSPRSSRRGW